MTDNPNLKPEDRALIELKPCPFCGHKPKLIKDTYGCHLPDEYPEGGRTWIVCPNPNCTSGYKFNAQADAAVAWNTRAEGRRSPGGDGEALAPGEGWARDWLTDALAKAYEDGAQDVHDNYEPNPDPEFGEAARDYAVNFVEGLPPVSSPPPSGEVREASPDLLAWLADHRRLELEYGYDDEFEAMFWRVHERSGNVNDREWDLIGQGETPLAALLSAKSYLEAKSADLTA